MFVARKEHLISSSILYWSNIVSGGWIVSSSVLFYLSHCSECILSKSPFCSCFAIDMLSLMNLVHLVQIGLAFLQTRLADVHEDHTNSGCSGQPTFSVETQFGVPALYMGCPICQSVQCVL